MFVAAAVVNSALALVLIASATGKLRRDDRQVSVLSRVGVPAHWFPRLAAAELAGALGLLVGLFFWPIAVAAGIGVEAYFIGALSAHLRAKDYDLGPAAVIGLVALVALILRLLST